LAREGKTMLKDQEPLPLKDLINFLFANVLHPDGRPYLTQEVAEHVRISNATINQLRTGRNKNPTVPTLQEIGRFFNVPLNYFDCKSQDECYEVLNASRSEHASGIAAEIAFRATDLSPQGQEDILKMILYVQAAERERKAGREAPSFSEFEDQPD
jgi:transcriptional regulator with XRE-family HTH domain